MKLGKQVFGLSLISLAIFVSNNTFAQYTSTSPSDPTATTAPAVATPPVPNTMPDSSMPAMQAAPSTVDQAAEQQRVEALVKAAADYIKQNGKDAAIAEFNKKDGSFSKGNDYIFALDYTGMSLADYNNPEMVGKNQYDLKSEDGKMIVQEGIAKAKAGGGWIQYRWKEPSTQAVTCKKSYVMGINNSYLIGSGYYYAPGPDGNCAP